MEIGLPNTENGSALNTAGDAAAAAAAAAAANPAAATSTANAPVLLPLSLLLLLCCCLWLVISWPQQLCCIRNHTRSLMSACMVLRLGANNEGEAIKSEVDPK